MDTPDPGALARLRDLRQALVRVHGAFLEWERLGYERVHGRQGGTEFLQVLLHDPAFAWLRLLSDAIVRVDQMLADPEAVDEATILVQVRALASPDAEGTPYAQRYLQAIQASPDAVLAHRDLLALLRRPR